MSNWNRVFKPIVVLVVICIIVTGALAATNKVTKPIIDEAPVWHQEQARKELLPDADNFTKVEGVAVENVSDIYTADNGVGTVITCSAKGYGGTVTVMVAFNPDDTIKQIKVTEAAETKGIGSNVTENSEYQANYSGLPCHSGPGPGYRCGRLFRRHYFQSCGEQRCELRHRRL